MQRVGQAVEPAQGIPVDDFVTVLPKLAQSAIARRYVANKPQRRLRLPGAVTCLFPHAKSGLTLTSLTSLTSLAAVRPAEVSIGPQREGYHFGGGCPGKFA